MAVQFKTEGTGKFINDLEKFNKDVAKALKKDIGRGAEQIVKAARADVIGNGLSGWGPWTHLDSGRDLSYEPSAVRSGIKRQTTRHRKRKITYSYSMDVVQNDAAGAIFEFAGSKNESGEFFADNIVARYGPVKKVPRRLGKAYYEVIDEVSGKIDEAVEAAEKKVGR